MERLGFTLRHVTVGPGGEELAVMELTRDRWAARRQSAV